MALLGSVLFLVLVGSSVSGTSGLRISAEPGENVTLPCRDPNSKRIFFLEWSKPNPRWEEMLYFCKKDGVLLGQDEYFQNRVILKNSQMKDGDLSVVLKNVTVNETGIYECKVLRENGPHRERKLISTISLVVFPSPPGEEGGWRGVSYGRLVLIAVLGLLLGVLVLPAVVVWNYKKKNGSNQSSGGSNNQKNPDRDPLISDSKVKTIPSNSESAD